MHPSSSGISRLRDRWRGSAALIALALGLNLWVSFLVVPASLTESYRGPFLWTVLLLPVAALATGIWKRNELLLLFVYPSTLLLPVALRPEVASMSLYSPLRFAIVALSLLLYLLASSSLTSFYEPPAPKAVRALASSEAPVPARWRRRQRMYVSIAILALVFPLLLLIRVNFDNTNAESMAANFPGRAATFTVLLNIAVIALWLGLFKGIFFSVLQRHRTGDRHLAYQLKRLKEHKQEPADLVRVVLSLTVAGLLALLWSAF